MGFLDKAKEAAEQAATKARTSVEDVQAKRDASQTYGELGRETFRLIEAGEVTHPALVEIADRIRAADAPAANGDAAAEAAGAAPPSAPAGGAPPAMPS
jgi:hypothetical protein